jgi:hypothetical protein
MKEILKKQLQKEKNEFAELTSPIDIAYKLGRIDALKDVLHKVSIPESQTECCNCQCGMNEKGICFSAWYIYCPLKRN